MSPRAGTRPGGSAPAPRGAPGQEPRGERHGAAAQTLSRAAVLNQKVYRQHAAVFFFSSPRLTRFDDVSVPSCHGDSRSPPSRSANPFLPRFGGGSWYPTAAAGPGRAQGPPAPGASDPAAAPPSPIPSTEGHQHGSQRGLGSGAALQPGALGAQHPRSSPATFSSAAFVPRNPPVSLPPRQPPGSPRSAGADGAGKGCLHLHTAPQRHGERGSAQTRPPSPSRFPASTPAPPINGPRRPRGADPWPRRLRAAGRNGQRDRQAAAERAGAGQAGDVEPGARLPALLRAQRACEERRFPGQFCS